MLFSPMAHGELLGDSILRCRFSVNHSGSELAELAEKVHRKSDAPESGQQEDVDWDAGPNWVEVDVRSHHGTLLNPPSHVCPSSL